MNETRQVIAAQNRTITTLLEENRRLKEETALLKQTLALRFEAYRVDYKRIMQRGQRIIYPIVVELIKASVVGSVPLKTIRERVKRKMRADGAPGYAETTINRVVEKLAERGLLVALGTGKHRYTLPEEPPAEVRL